MHCSGTFFSYPRFNFKVSRYEVLLTRKQGNEEEDDSLVKPRRDKAKMRELRRGGGKERITQNK